MIFIPLFVAIVFAILVLLGIFCYVHKILQGKKTKAEIDFDRAKGATENIRALRIWQRNIFKDAKKQGWKIFNENGKEIT